MHFNLTVYLMAFSAVTGVIAVPLPVPKPTVGTGVKDIVDNVPKTPKWKESLLPWVGRIAALGFVHSAATKAYPWLLGLFYNRYMADDYAEVLDSLQEETVDTETDDDALPGGTVEF